MRGEITYLGVTIPFERGSYKFFRSIQRNGKPASEVFFKGFKFKMTANQHTLRFLEHLLEGNKKLKDHSRGDSNYEPHYTEILNPVLVKVYDENEHPFRGVELLDAHIKNYKEFFKS